VLFLIDRVILMHYSIDAMNAAMFGGHLVAIYSYILIVIAGTTEIFVGQYNGAKEYEWIASPVWQMIYFVIVSLIFVIPIGFFSEHLNLIPSYAREGIEYQRILTYFCWIPALTAAFTGFFVGRGKTQIITVIVVVGSLINVALDWLFVFGYEDIIPSMGCRGAAIATIISEAIQMGVLAMAFWSKKNRTTCGTGKNYRFNAKLFCRCLKIGAPMAFGRCAEMFALYIVHVALGRVSKELASVQGIATTIYVLFAFICEGLTKGTATISANFIGQKNLAAIRVTFKNLIYLTLILCFTVMLPLLLAPDSVFQLLRTLNEDIAPLSSTVQIIFRILFVNITVEALCSIPWGILISGGDSKYPIIVNLASAWGLVVVPVLTLFSMGKLNSAVTVHLLSTCWISVCLLLVYLRYRGLKWYKSVIY
jgi:MATE family multidrug resistance protein